LNLPTDMVKDNPLDIKNIKEQQDKDIGLQQEAEKYADRYTSKQIGTVDGIICYVKPGDAAASWKIRLPQLLLKPTIKWFHQVTGHPGSKQLCMQISSGYYHRDLRSLIDKFHCEHCQRNKLGGKGYELLPECESTINAI